jgi:hypothetical protein
MYLSVSLSMALQPFVGPWPLFRFLILYTVGMTPRTGDQPVTRHLPTYRTTQTQNKRTDIHALSGIRTYDPERAKAVYALDRATTATGIFMYEYSLTYLFLKTLSVAENV